jgi:hypothetical protein
VSKANWQQYEASLRKLLADRDTRIFFWRLIVEDCKVFQEDYPVNATAYSLLAKQSVGKRILADAKRVDASAVFRAEAEYNEFMEQVARLEETSTEGEY